MESYTACPDIYFPHRELWKVSEMETTQSMDMCINQKAIFIDW